MKHMNFSIIGVDFYWISSLFFTTEVAMKSTLRVNRFYCLHVVVPSVRESSILLLSLRLFGVVGTMHIKNLLMA